MQIKKRHFPCLAAKRKKKYCLIKDGKCRTVNFNNLKGKSKKKGMNFSIPFRIGPESPILPDLQRAPPFSFLSHICWYQANPSLAQQFLP